MDLVERQYLNAVHIRFEDSEFAVPRSSRGYTSWEGDEDDGGRTWDATDASSVEAISEVLRVVTKAEAVALHVAHDVTYLLFGFNSRAKSKAKSRSPGSPWGSPNIGGILSRRPSEDDSKDDVCEVKLSGTLHPSPLHCAIQHNLNVNVFSMSKSKTE